MPMITMNEKEQAEGRKSRPYINYILLFAVCIIGCVALYFIYDMNDIRALQMLVLCIIGLLTSIFAFNAGGAYNTLFSDNINHPERFYVAFMLMMAIVILLPAMPAVAWPVVIIYVLLTILGNVPSGISAGSVCLLMAAMSQGASAYAYAYVYLFCGIAASVLVSHIDEEFKTTLPVFIIELMLFMGLGVTIVTTLSTISIEILIYPVVNATVTLIFLVFFMKLYSAKVVFKKRDNYLELNDPECQLLTRLKTISPEDYHKTVHIVYFCDRVSAAVGLDAQIVKCAGLYHRIGVILGAYNWENTKAVCTEGGIPQDVLDILEEFEDASVPMRRAETTVLYMADCVVNSIQFLFTRNKDFKLDYADIVEAIFKQKYDAGVFKTSELSLSQYEKMKTVFKEEKLYYDFLR